VPPVLAVAHVISKKLSFCAACLFFGLAIGSRARADSPSAQVIGLFPRNCAEFSYADLAKARQFSWFVPFQMDVLPVRLYRFENFLTSPQMGAGNQLNGVAWAFASGDASPGSGFVGVVIGDFDTQAADSYLASQKTPSFAFEGYRIYASGSDFGDSEIFFAFIDSNTVVFGMRGLVEDVIRVHGAEEHSLDDNAKMIALIDQANGNDIFWGVFDAEGAQEAMRQLVPDAATFPGAAQWIGRMTALMVGVEGSSDTDISLSMQAIAASPQDALILSQLFQAGIALKRYQAAQDDPPLTQILDSADVAANGNQLGLSLNLTNDQVVSLLEHDAFLVPGM
jgi:hypothetical protein